MSPSSPSLSPGWITPQLLEPFTAAATNAHRVFNSPRCWIERFDRDYLVSHTTPDELRDALAGLPDWCAAHSLPLDRIYGKHLADTEHERIAPKLLHGDTSLSPQTVVTENGVRYGLDFAASYSAGLFIDQRANRSAVRKNPPKKILNTFAYTCSFSVIAAMAGASTVSVDLSKKSLDRGRANFLLNGIDSQTEANRILHRFIADDVFGVIPYLERRMETFDTIILDPPTFSHGTKSKVFRAERDMGKLLDLALRVAAPRCRILLSTNCTRLTRRDLEVTARACIKGRGVGLKLDPSATLPDIPDSGMPSTLWLSVG